MKAQQKTFSPKKRRVLFAAIILILLLGLCVQLPHFLSNGRVVFCRYFSNRLLPRSAQAVELYDSHGGFHNDGCRLVSFALSGRQARTFADAAIADGWKGLPLDGEIRHFLYADGRADSLAGEMGLPAPEKGVWKLVNSGDPYPYMNNGVPMNFKLAILDASSGVLYLMEYDM